MTGDRMSGGGQFWDDLREGLKDPEFRREYITFSQEIAARDAAANAPTGDRTPLRERLMDALRADTYPYGYGDVRGDVLDIADAVLPVVEAETAALRDRAEQAERERDDALEALAYGAETLRRAEAVERRAEQAEAAVERVRALCWRGPGPANEFQIWTVDVLAALEPPKETP